MVPSTPLPSGTITFLLTDIEGSTRLWEQHPEAMADALARHDALAAALIAEHAGSLLKSRGEGDSLFAVFSHATDAVAAALALQRAFLSLSADDADKDRGEEAKAGSAVIGETSAPDSERSSDASHLSPSASSADKCLNLRVRIALHTGDAALREGDYFGPAVNRCARLRAAAHGGQLLLSQAVCDAVQDHLPEGAGLRDLGLHRLKDLQQPERIYQLLHAALPADFPPLRSLEAFRHNLPAQLTSFIGREREMAEVRRLLESSRLLTLTGAGGCGKTRLALQVAADRVEAYPDGVWFVQLAALADPALVPQTVATALGVREEPSRRLTATLVDYLRGREALLLVDNCEHLLTAAAQLTEELLRECPRLQILATSREGLGILGEQSYRIPPLSMPTTGRESPEALQEYEAVQLFAERARLSQPGFTVTAGNGAAVAEVCQRLDGIPLAIELAAARVKVLSIEQIAARLGDRFRLLTGGSRTALPRQQTLRALIDWSYDLLAEPERLLLLRLSVFAGGWTLEAAEAVCAGDGVEEWEVLDLLTALVDKSLVLYEEQHGEVRYRLLETVRQYARDRLLESGEGSAVRGRHVEFFLGLAERSEPELPGPNQGEWLHRLEKEHGNLRVALDSSQAADDGAERGLRLAGVLWWFWESRGYHREGRGWLERVLERSTGAPGALRAKTMIGASILAEQQGDNQRAAELGEESLFISREVDDKWLIAHSLLLLGANAYYHRGDTGQARALLEESLTLSREVGQKRGIALALTYLGALARSLEDHGLAWSLFEEGLAIRRELGDKAGIAYSLLALAGEARLVGDSERARSLAEESLVIGCELGDRPLLVRSFRELARVAGTQRRPERVARLFSAAAGLCEAIHLRPTDALDDDAASIAAACAALGEEAFAAVWAEGRVMSLEQAVEFALEACDAEPEAEAGS